MHIESLPLCFPLRLLVGKCKPQKRGHVVALKHVGISFTFLFFSQMLLCTLSDVYIFGMLDACLC